MQIKVFSGKPATVEENVNKFLKTKHLRIKMLNQSECEDYFTISILYEIDMSADLTEQ